MDVAERRSTPLIAGVAAGVVVACALLFAIVGVVTGDDGGDGGDGPVIAGDTSSAPDDRATTGGDAPSPSTSADDGATTSDRPTASASATGSDQPSDAPPPEDVDPAEVSIQVLDAVGDGGAAAQQVADELRTAGFNVIVINGASRAYDQTTVFWSEGQGPGGRAVAAELGSSQASRTPDDVRLSDEVDVHVVVGADRA